MQSSTARSHFKNAAWRSKRDRQLRQRAPSEKLGGPIIHYAAGCTLFPFRLFMAGREVGPISTTSVFGGVFCSVKRTHFDVRSARCLPILSMTPNRETRMIEGERKARALP
jgi:hypothetical protein